jgi:hypothetical protein
MTIELIPVIEIGYNNQEVQEPDKYPYWEHSVLWDKYHNDSYLIAGFKDRLTPYLSGSSFYRLTDISDENLKKLTVDHTQDLKEQSCSFFGGYVLKIDGQDKLFPQCCGLLADINFWGKISQGQQSYYEGHPAPQITFHDTLLIFDVTTNEFDEHFQPTPPTPIFKVDRTELIKAVEKVKDELKLFGLRLKKINEELTLGIKDIDNVLIWYDDNY